MMADISTALQNVALIPGARKHICHKMQDNQKEMLEVDMEQAPREQRLLFVCMAT